jgi:hypothetical protein
VELFQICPHLWDLLGNERVFAFNEVLDYSADRKVAILFTSVPEIVPVKLGPGNQSGNFKFLGGREKQVAVSPDSVVLPILFL